MIRANLLPRPKETVRVLGLSFDGDYLRRALSALGTVLTVAGLGVGIESLRLHRLQDAGSKAEAVLAAHAAERTDTQRLALEVARYQEFAREAQAMRHSGARAAGAIARIGNRMPSDVWLDSIGPSGTGYGLSGGSNSVDALGVAALSLGRALPSERAAIVSTERHDRDSLHFTARLANPAPDATPLGDAR